MRVTQQHDGFTELLDLVPCDLSKRHCFAKHGLLESKPLVPQRARLHMLLVRGLNPLGFDKSLEAHTADLAADQAENWHPAYCTLALDLRPNSSSMLAHKFPIQHQLNAAT